MQPREGRGGEGEVYLSDLSNLALVRTGNNLDDIASLHVHGLSYGLAIGCEVIVLPLLPWPLYMSTCNDINLGT